MAPQPTGSRGWGIPKGGVEAGETLEAAARREFFEETGISLLACGCEDR
jgi:8-oxo-dGTP pyrophosphatase MutT (NUDIX family)